MIGRLASSLSIQSAMPPKLMQPRQSLETCVPVAPIRTYFIGPILVWEMLEDRRSGADGVSRPALPRRVLLDRDQSALIGGARGWRGGPREAALRSRSSTARGRAARPRGAAWRLSARDTPRRPGRAATGPAAARRSARRRR